MVYAKLVLLRHGQSEWNLLNIFTGWTDVDLSENGEKECLKAAELLKKHNYKFDKVYTSVLKRAIRTTEIVLKEMGHDEIEMKKSWRLNERHYGALQGLNKDEMRKKFGEEQVFLWRRSFDVKPPMMEENDERYKAQCENKIFENVPKNEMPKGESLEDTVKRVLPYWKGEIAPELKKGKTILVSAHGNSIRAIVKHLDAISDSEIPKKEIPTGVPLVYEFDEDLKPLKHYYLE